MRGVTQVFTDETAGSLPANETVLEENNLVVFTEWSEWSSCNKCGFNAQRKKVGDCKVKVGCFDQRMRIVKNNMSTSSTF
jgi:hypothetical protein